MKGKGKVTLIVVMVLVGSLLILLTVVSKLGIVENGTTFAEAAAAPKEIYKIDTLKNNQLYIWKDFEGKAIDDSDNIFFNCPTGNPNVKYKDKSTSDVKYTIWIPAADDSSIPTLTRNDKLIYISQESVPDTFDFLRMYENGYSIGITSLIADASDHYYIDYIQTDKNDYKKSINVNSDAKDLAGYLIERLYLDKVGDMTITSKNISEGGVVKGLKKNEQYICEFYTGTYYQDFLLTASEHTFTELEDFTCYGYEFLHSNCISIDIPEWLCSGYYYINGIGLFRFVDDEDIDKYTGLAYDENIDWNDPLILYDEFGQVIYDPSRPEIGEQFQVTEDDMEEDIIEESSAVSVEPSDSMWSYSIDKKQKVFSAEIKLAEIVNSPVATVIVTKPDGSVEAFAENDNVISVKINKAEPGAYAFTLQDAASRTFDVTYSTGDVYSGEADRISEPEGDD